MLVGELGLGLDDGECGDGVAERAGGGGSVAEAILKDGAEAGGGGLEGGVERGGERGDGGAEVRKSDRQPARVLHDVAFAVANQVLEDPETTPEV